MVDRLEELLAQAADEDDEEQEDVLALEAERAAPAAPVPGSQDRPESGTGPEGRGGTGQGERAAPAPPEGEMPWGGHPRAGGGRPAEDGRPVPGREDGLTALRVLRAGEGRSAEWPRAAKPAAAVGGEAVPAPGRATGTEDATPPGAAAGVENVPTPSETAERGLEGLYRRTVQAARPAAPVQGQPAPPAGRTRYAGEPGRAAALTVDELDRAVRRDSRRYDGGMSIY